MATSKCNTKNNEARQVKDTPHAVDEYDVPIEAFVNWLGWLEQQMEKGTGDLCGVQLAFLLRNFAADLRDPVIQKCLEDSPRYWVYGTKQRRNTIGNDTVDLPEESID